ncbi:MAG: hypothetical protein H8D23_01500 [Candidatus Brocadiales bacterium]|nr:hypothetical protein [Candidatus Brocadiales bacterium]
MKRFGDENDCRIYVKQIHHWVASALFDIEMRLNPENFGHDRNVIDEDQQFIRKLKHDNSKQ